MKRLGLRAIALAGVLVVFVAVQDCRAAGGFVTAQPAEKPAAIAAIEQAAGPSEVISAFTKALAGGEDKAAVYSAFVHRMVQLGLPQATYDQAQTAVGLDPSDKVSWAVIAFTQASTGKMEEALSSLAKASPQADDDPFVVKTAGQLLAWYDSTPDQAVTDETRKAVEDVRKRLADNGLFMETYQTTMEAFQLYRLTGAEKPTAPSGQAPTPAEPNAQSVAVENRTIIIYPQPNVVYGYSYPLFFPSPRYYRPFIRWPRFPPVSFPGDHRHRGSDRDDHRDRDADRPRDGGKGTDRPSPGGRRVGRSASVPGVKVDSLLASDRQDRTTVEDSSDRRVPVPFAPARVLMRDGDGRDFRSIPWVHVDRAPDGRRSR